MDPLSNVLELLSAKSYTTSGLSAPAHWGLHYPGFDGLKFVAVQKGIARFKTDGENQWHTLHEGDGIILTRSLSFFLTTSAGKVLARSEDTPFIVRNGIAYYGGDDLVMIAGKMEVDKDSGDVLLNELPPVIFITAGSVEATAVSWLMTYIQSEKLHARPGSSIVTDHLMHLIMIEGIRSCLTQKQFEKKGWMAALHDPKIMKTLTALHDEPAREWRLPELASISGMSRAGFTRRFTQLIGDTPLRYLTSWRMRIASKTLRNTQDPIKKIGFSLGYLSESTFSTAFKRVHGHSPSEHRRKAKG